MIDNSYGEKQVLPVLCVPVELKVGEDTLPIGHYQVVGEKVDGQAVLKFYQSQYEMAQFPAVETTSDFGEDTICNKYILFMQLILLCSFYYYINNKRGVK